MGRKPFAMAGSFDDDLVAGVCKPVMGAVPGMGSSKRLSHSSTALLEVMTNLETWRRQIMNWSRSADCWEVRR